MPSLNLQLNSIKEIYSYTDFLENNSDDVSLASVEDKEAEGEASSSHIESQLSLRVLKLDDVKRSKSPMKKKSKLFSTETIKYCCTLTTLDIWIIFFMIIMYTFYGSNYGFLHKFS